MTVRLKAIKNMVYAGKRIASGTEFLARGESDAQILTAIKSAERVKESAVVKAPTYSHRMMVAEAPRADAPQEVMPILHIADSVDVLPESSDSSDDTYVINSKVTVGDLASKPDVVADMRATFAPYSVPAPESDLDAMDRDVLFNMAVSMGLKPHHLTGIAKLRAAIESHRAQ